MPTPRRPAAADRRRWNELHAAYEAARAATRDYESQLRSGRYGWGDPSWRSWITKTERGKLERLEARADTIGDKIVDLLVRISPRGEAWLTGAPAWWIRERLTWEDAVRPADEPLSVVVPAPYGRTEGLRQEARAGDEPMTYEEAKRLRDDAEEQSKAASAVLRAFPRLANGLVPDAVKFSPEYRAAKARYDAAFAHERAVNEWFVKTFKEEIRAERAFRGRRLREPSIDSWQDYLAPGEARYVPAIVRPQMPDVVRRAAAAGMPPGTEYVGAGMTGVVFCAGATAFKVARDTRPIDHHLFEDEAEWLASTAAVPAVAPHVAHLRRFDPENLVIVRDCPHPDPDQSHWRWESKLHELHGFIERAMIPHGWTAPEFKPDSYVLTPHGPILVDASMPSRVGAVLAQYVEDVVSGARPLWTTRPHDLTFEVRREVGQTLTQAEADHLQAILERRWPEARW